MHALCRSFLNGLAATTLLAGLLALGGERQAAAGLALGSSPAAGAPAPQICLANPICPKESYCSKPEGECKGKGMCESRPKVCPENYLPVCGCNDKTYNNSCWAAAAGVSLKAQGTCAQAVKCTSNAQCGSGDFCAKPDGKCGSEGICAQRPVLCPPGVAPVCGCDGQSYNNRCEAFVAGVDVNHTGTCGK